MTEKRNDAITTSYRETRIGKTVYRVTSVYLGEKDLKETLEQLAVKRTIADMNATCQVS